MAHGPTYALGVSSTGLALRLHRPAAHAAVQSGAGLSTPEPEEWSELRLRLTGASGSARVAGLDEQPGRSNYFIGNDPAQWHRSVPHFKGVKIAGAYAGVDLVLYGNGQQLEYDFAVAPGADPGRIGLQTDGAEAVAIDAGGNALLRTALGDVELKRPVAYQEVDGRRQPVESGFRLAKGRVLGFEVGKYDRTRPLTIDPVLVYAVSLGGANENTGMGLAFDASGNTYFTGHTCSADFPSTGGAYQTFPNNQASHQCDAAFLIKMDPTGGTLIFSDFIGGTGVSTGSHVAVDSSGNIYLAGATGAANFATVGNIGPTAPAACGIAQAGFTCSQGFILKLSADGSQLLFSSLLGGGQASGAYQVKLNPVSGDLDVLGATNSSNFEPAPTTLETTYGGGSCSGGNPCFNAFLLGLNPATGALRYGTFIGGAGNVWASGLGFDGSGNIYVTGSAQGALSSSLGSVTHTYAPAGGATAAGTSLFVAKLNLSGTTLTPGYLTMIQGDADTGSSGLALDTTGNVYFGGATAAQHLPVTTGVFQATNKATLSNSCYWGAVVTPFLPTACGTGVVGELNSAGALTFLTYLGGSSQDMVEAIGVDSSGNIWLTGVTLSMDFPYTADQYKINGFGMVPFLAEMSNSGTQLPFATELAGDTGESTDLQIDSANNIYVAGDGIQPPSTPGTYPPNPSAFGSAYLQKWNPGPEPVLAISPSVFVGFPDTPQGAASAPQVVTLQNTGGGAMTLSVQLQQNIVSTNATDFVVTTTCGATLAGNSSCTISMVFAPGPAICVKGPTCAPASRFAEILINDNAPQGMQYLELSANAAAGAGMSAVPNPVVFPAQAAGTTSSPMLGLEVGSDGDTALVISSIVLGGANASDFTFTTAGQGGNNCATDAIEPGSLCFVGLTFSPPASATGTRTARLTFTDNAGDSPQTVNITGTVAGASALTISPLTVSIGPVAIGTSTYGQVTLQNPSANSIQVTSLAVSGTNMGDFSPALAGCSSTTLPVTIAAGANCYLDITFNPAAGASGQRTATLTVGTSPAITGLPTVALVGDAVTNSQPGMTTFEVPNPMNFGGLQVGETSNNASVLFTIYNNAPIPCAGGASTCGAPLIVNSITPGLSDYTLTGEGGVASPCTTFPASIPAFGYCTYVVVFKPVQAGSRNTTLTIASNDPQGPLQLPVYGTGLSLPLAELLNTELDFGNSAIGVAS
ncbi:MAG: choice-of-anchor D domain-containing protein, partial [Acidobacteriaceae bacterium]